LGTRYDQERTAGASPADVVTIADELFINHAQEKGWLESDLSDLPAVANWPEDFFDDGVAITTIAPLGIAYNTNAVSDPPKTWEDTLDARFKGRIQNGDPRTAPVYLAQMYLLRETYGSEFLHKLAAMGTTYQASQLSVTQGLAAGESDLSLTSSYQMAQQLAADGAPIEFQDMSPAVGSVNYGAVSTDAAHPNAARLLINYLLTPEGQTEFSRDLASPLGTDAVPTSIPLPEGWQQVSMADVEAARTDVLADLGLQ
jgi:ABC-type Fe3+ transport system substrate-binding protein